ncbi:acyl carrier protein [Rheinheimera baltica]|uniref:acyl carrier protein n=1 Tax=Rheinheimera baltica TaxID=67576 RepID=UPI00273DA323|nr:acyl carrier protein [Rheinheimera baltica]MDP5142186.1 acyl carrier protein [Rheinheimera baltica]
MSEHEIKTIILNAFKSKSILGNIAPDQDFFDVGASSLTVVDLQIQIEEQLQRSVPTSKLMANPTINGWVEHYIAA